MSAERFYNAIPKELHGNDRSTIAYFVYYLVEELGQEQSNRLEVRAKCCSWCSTIIECAIKSQFTQSGMDSG